MVFLSRKFSMIDPKGDVVTDMQSEHVEVLEKRLADAQQEIIKYQRMVQDEARDHSIMLPMLQHFTTRLTERGEFEQIQDALQYAYDDTGIDWDDIAEAVDRMGICDPDLCKREYNVRVTIPVEITVSVQATSYENAESVASDEVEYNGLSDYYMEYDLWNAEYYVEEA